MQIIVFARDVVFCCITKKVGKQFPWPLVHTAIIRNLSRSWDEWIKVPLEMEIFRFINIQKNPFLYRFQWNEFSWKKYHFQHHLIKQRERDLKKIRFSISRSIRANDKFHISIRWMCIVHCPVKSRGFNSIVFQPFSIRNIFFKVTWNRIDFIANINTFCFENAVNFVVE